LELLWIRIRWTARIVSEYDLEKLNSGIDREDIPAVQAG
jgi:hypothetical protein